MLLATTSLTIDGAPVANISVTDKGGIQVGYRAVPQDPVRNYFQGNDVAAGQPLAEAGIFLRHRSNGAPDVVYGAPLQSATFETALISDPSQTGPAGRPTSQTSGNGRIVTTMQSPAGAAQPFKIRQTVSYDGESDYFRVDNVVTNTGPNPLAFDFLFAADLALSPESPGKATFDATTQKVGSDGEGQDIFFQGASLANPPDRYQESDFRTLAATIGGPGDLTNTVTDPLPAGAYDNGMALEWAGESLAPGAARTYSYDVAFDAQAVQVAPPEGFLTTTPLRNTNDDATYQFEIGYYPDFAAGVPIDPSTIGAGDAALRRADGLVLPASLVRINHDEGSSDYFGIYQVTAPAGGFGGLSYQAVLNPDQVKNTDGVAVPGQTFDEPILAGPLQAYGSADTSVLAGKLLAPNAGLTVTDLQVTSLTDGDGAVSTGFFNNPGGVYNLGSTGVVLSTGDVNQYSAFSDTGGDGAVGGGLFGNSSTVLGPTDAGPSTTEEAALDAIAPGDHYDVSVLTVTFAAGANVTDVFFDLAWGTVEQAGLASSDALGVFLNGVNVAFTPKNGNLAAAPIDVRNPSLSVGGITGTILTNLVAPNGDPLLHLSNRDPRTGAVIPLGATNTLKIVIADTGNAERDSTVYLSGLTAVRTPVADPGFGGGGGDGGGRLTTDFTTETIEWSTPEGRLYAVGHDAAGTQLVVARFAADGTPDPAFDGDGRAVYAPGGRVVAYSVIPLAAGGAVVVGEAGTGDATDMLILKYTAAGALDPAFGGGDGVVTVDFAGKEDAAYDVAVDPAGRLVAVGTATLAGVDPQNGSAAEDEDFAVVRLAADGTPDATFGTGGKVTAGFDTAGGLADDLAGSVELSGDRIVVAGASGGDVAVLALTAAAGALDPTFGAAGTAKPDLRTTDYTVGLTVQPDGKLLLAGYARGNTQSKVGGDFGLIRLNADGSDDASFGLFNGLTGQDLGGFDDADDIVQVTDPATGQRTVYVYGTSTIDNATGDDVVLTAVARFTADGLPLALAGGAGNASKFDGVATTLPAGAQAGDFTSTGDGGSGDGGGDGGDGGGFTPSAVSFGGLASNKASAATDGTGAQFAFKGSGGGTSTARLIGRVNLGTPTPTPTGTDRRSARGSAVDTFGAGVDKKRKKLSFTDADGTVVTMTLTGGSATYYFTAADDALHLDVSGTTVKAALSIATKGGDGRVRLGLVNVMSPLKSFAAKSADLVDTLYVDGPVGTVDLGSAAGATLAVNGAMKALTVRGGLASTTVLCGGGLGSDGQRGAFDGSPDTYAGSLVGKVSILGAVTGSHVAVGVDPGADGALGTADDQYVGGDGSTFKSLKVKGGVDATSTFSVSGALPKKVTLPEKVVPADDGRFEAPAAAAAAAAFDPPADAKGPATPDGFGGVPLPFL